MLSNAQRCGVEKKLLHHHITTFISPFSFFSPHFPLCGNVCRHHRRYNFKRLFFPLILDFHASKERIFIPSLHALLVSKEVTKRNIFFVFTLKRKASIVLLLVLYARKAMEFLTFVYFCNQTTMKKRKCEKKISHVLRRNM